MLRFSLARLFVSIGLIAAGCAVLTLIRQARSIGHLLPPGPERHILVGGALLIIGSSFVVAGMGNLFRRPIVGAAIGLILIVVFIMIVFAVQEFSLR